MINQRRSISDNPTHDPTHDSSLVRLWHQMDRRPQEPTQQSSSKLIKAHQSSSELIRVHQSPSEPIRAHQSYQSYQSYQKAPEGIRRHQKASDRIRSVRCTLTGSPTQPRTDPRAACNHLLMVPHAIMCSCTHAIMCVLMYSCNHVCAHVLMQSCVCSCAGALLYSSEDGSPCRSATRAASSRTRGSMRRRPPARFPPFLGSRPPTRHPTIPASIWHAAVCLKPRGLSPVQPLTVQPLTVQCRSAYFVVVSGCFSRLLPLAFLPN